MRIFLRITSLAYLFFLILLFISNGHIHHADDHHSFSAAEHSYHETDHHEHRHRHKNEEHAFKHIFDHAYTVKNTTLLNKKIYRNAFIYRPGEFKIPGAFSFVFLFHTNPGMKQPRHLQGQPVRGPPHIQAV